MQKVRRKDKNIFETLFVCKNCCKIILEIYAYTHPIKMLCPKCEADINKKCDMCDPSKILHSIQMECEKS